MKIYFCIFMNLETCSEYLKGIFDFGFYGPRQ